MARPAGARNVRPSKAEVAAYHTLLRRAADRGDPAAAGALILADRLDALERALPKQHELDLEERAHG